MSIENTESIENTIEAQGLMKRYGDLVAVGGLDLHVERGTCLGLLGPNGAGKTTTIEILEGLTDADNVVVVGQTGLKDGTEVEAVGDSPPDRLAGDTTTSP